MKPNFELDILTGALFCTYEVCKMNFTGLSCYLSMSLAKTHTLMQKINITPSISAKSGFIDGSHVPMREPIWTLRVHSPQERLN